ncbi:MAG TPA: hypothetical protein VKV24_03165 [Casimicrobiaceae bacterium]|nr:hypothetical protein [Casimicrobiaceae bacterium]
MYLGKDTSRSGIEPDEWAAHAARRLQSRETVDVDASMSRPARRRRVRDLGTWESADDSRLVDLLLDIARSGKSDASPARDRVRAETHWTRILSLDLAERDDESLKDDPALLDDPCVSRPATGEVRRDAKETADRVAKLLIRGIVVLAAVCAALYLAVAALVHMAKSPDATAALVPQLSPPEHAASVRPRDAPDTSRMY